jgi:uncharacterized membrane protein
MPVPSKKIGKQLAMICGLSSQPIKKNKNAERMAKGRKKTNQHQIAPRNVPNVAISKVETTSFQGPLPPPQILSQYDQIVPGSAERIISQWESQSRHRQELEKKVIDSDIKQSRYGATLGFIVAIFTIGAGAFLAYIGQPTEGFAAIITALASLVGAYGWGSYQRRKERTTRVNQ